MRSPGARGAAHGGGEARPLLKWAGGKRHLLPFIRRFYPPEFGSYFEPFVGSGAVFLDLHHCGALAGHRVRLSDTNADVIGCYRAIRDHPEAVIAALQRLEAGHRRRGAAHYYGVRDGRFNPLRQRNARQPAGCSYTPELAAMLVYLNRTGYNGLFRLNASGLFNVPAGRYVNPRILDAGNLRRFAAALGRRGVTLARESYAAVLGRARPGDFIYFDPPYAPVSQTARFTAYTAGGFGPEDQRHLQRIVVALARRGCHVLLSNSTAPEIVALYGRNRAADAAGLRAYRIPARRAISSNGAGRGPVWELLVSNGPPQGHSPVAWPPAHLRDNGCRL